ncbi:monovalent cation:proton antiporter-2 (CPA2) family protein [soil metagenome]
MHTPQLFTDLLVILLASVPVAFLCLRLRLPLVVGFMLTGIAIGPYGLGLISDISGVEILAEIGVMLLLFSIGLEFSLARLREMKRLVLLGGGLQVGVTIGVVAFAAYMVGREIEQAVFFGFLVALSSTAIVLKSYVDRNEVDAPHGRAGVGILLFQDISIVFMLLLIPMLAGQGSESMSSVIVSLGSSLLALVLIVAGAWLLIPKFLGKIVRLRSPEVFLLTVVLLCLGLSWVTSHFGLSLALGAFIAGMVLADSDYNHQVTAEVLPFRDVFNSIFFVSMGLLLSLSALLANLGSVLLIFVGLIVVKALIIWAIVRILGSPQRVAAMVGLGLAQIGEFSFILARAGKGSGLLPEDDYQTFLAASILSMIATPFMIAFAPRFGLAIQTFMSDGPVGEIENIEEDIHLTSSGGLEQHVIIVGYGLNGRNLSRVLRSVAVSYTILDVNADAVRRAKDKGEKINFGDATRREVLIHAGIERAWVLVLAMSDPHASRRTVALARSLSKRVHIIVRTRYTAEITGLLSLGADEVIPEEFETSIEIFARVLYRFGVPNDVIEDQISHIRGQGYEMLRSASLPPVVMGNLNAALLQAITETVTLNSGSNVIGKTLGELDLRNRTGATVVAVIRSDKTKVSPGAGYVFHENDTIVLSGSSPKIKAAINILQGEAAVSKTAGPVDLT